MLLSLQWLREFVPFEGTSAELAEKLTMLGLEVEEIFNPFSKIASIRVGHVLECAAHPDSEHLSLCRVDLGDEVVPIVCGAKNVAAGQKVAVAPVGTTMPGGMVIKKAKLRGEVSLGMICSESELELAQESDGIMILEDSAVVGMPLAEWLGLENCVLDVSITPNRADCLSVLGIARDLSAAFDLPLTLPNCELKECEEKTVDSLGVEVENLQDCPLYVARIVQNTEVLRSPDWLRYRLQAVGLRSINAIVDITNFLMLETGQPLHAFDLSLLEGGKVFVRRAKSGEKLTTLDGKERVLQENDLVIADSKKAIALAGIMGGENTEITDSCRNVLLECAVFYSPLVRKTARRLGISTDSSFRFERGVDRLQTDFVLDRAASLIAELSGGKVLCGKVKKAARAVPPTTVSFTPQRARDLLALEISDKFCLDLLTRLGCKVETAMLPWQVVSPSFRFDLEREADLIEEIGRVWGMDKIPTCLPQIRKNQQSYNAVNKYNFWRQVKHWAKGIGLHECINYSFLSGAELEKLGLSPSGQARIFNPLTDEQDTLRPEILPGLFENVRRNLSQGHSRLRFFEMAHVFLKDGTGESGIREKNHLAILLSGNREQGGFANGNAENVDYLDLKGVLEHFAASFHLPKTDYVTAAEHAYLQPAVEWRVDGKVCGILGMLKPNLLNRYNASAQIWCAEIDLDSLQSQKIVFLPLPRFPHVQRDMTLIAGQELHFSEIERELNVFHSDLLESVDLLDIYTPEGGTDKHITLRLTYRHLEKTLKDKEVDKVHTRLGLHLLEKLAVRFP